MSNSPVFNAIVKALFFVQLVLIVIRTIYWIISNKHYNRCNTSRKCQWLVTSEANKPDECGYWLCSIWHKMHDNKCEKKRCLGYVPEHSNFSSQFSNTVFVKAMSMFCDVWSIIIAIAALYVL